MQSLSTVFRLAIVLSLLSGCNSNGTGQAPVAPRIMSYSALRADNEEPQFFRAEPKDEQAQSRGRMVIKKAEIRLEVANYDDAFTRIRLLANSNNGFVVSSEASSKEEQQKSGEVSMRIPLLKFEAVVESVKCLATRIEDVSIRGNDVTEEFYDVEARLRNKQKLEERLTDILKVATKVKEILEIERALSDTRGAIEQLTGRKRFLADQVELSTVDVEMHEPHPVIATGSDGFLSKVVRGLQRGVDSFGDVVSVSITILLALSPILTIGLILTVLGIRMFKHRLARAG